MAHRRGERPAAARLALGGGTRAEMEEGEIPMKSDPPGHGFHEIELTLVLNASHPARLARQLSVLPIYLP